MEQIIKKFTLDFFGKGKHKISPEEFFEMENGVFLDVRSTEEAKSISIKLELHNNQDSVQIPINEIPNRIDEIPKGKKLRSSAPQIPEHPLSMLAYYRRDFRIFAFYKADMLL